MYSIVHIIVIIIYRVNLLLSLHDVSYNLLLDLKKGLQIAKIINLQLSKGDTLKNWIFCLKK